MREGHQQSPLGALGFSARAQVHEAREQLRRGRVQLTQERVGGLHVLLTDLELDRGAEALPHRGASVGIVGVLPQALGETEARLGEEPVGPREIRGHAFARVAELALERVQALERRVGQRARAPVPEKVVQLLAELTRALGPIAVLSRRRPVAEAREALGHVAVVRDGSGDRGRLEGGEEAIGRVPRFAREDLVERRAEEIDVRPLVDVHPERHLRSHVRGRSRE